VIDKIDQGASAPEEQPSQRLRKKHRGYLGCVLGLSLGLMGLAASRLGHLWVAFDVFSQFTLQFIFLIAAFAIGLFMPRAKILCAIVLFIAMLVSLSIWPYYASEHVKVLGKAAETERTLKFASFNTWYDNDKIDDVRKEIARINADVFVVIEFSPNKQRIHDQLKSQYPYQAQCPANDDCEFGIFSKHPLDNVKIMESWVGPSYIRASLGPDFGGLTVFGVHTTRFPHSRAQFTQIKAMGAEIDRVVGPHVVMGDFNSTPFSRVTQTFANDTGMTQLTSLPSWPARLGLPQISIDHIFASAGVRALSTESIGENAGSDHFPIFMTLAVPAK
jgi:endonuclease/exonuclease/phosphatase (EEP) superfamily protein YafD